jgi:hypothetical protein
VKKSKWWGKPLSPSWERFSEISILIIIIAFHL